MLTIRKPSTEAVPPLPRAVPAMTGSPPRPPTRNNNVLATHEQFAEEAKRVAQRYYDQVAEIERLCDDRDTWCNRALLAEGEVARGEKREAEQAQHYEKRIGELERQIDHKHAELTRERDTYRQAFAVVGAQFTAASKILLDGFAAIQGAEKTLGPIPIAAEPQPAPLPQPEPAAEPEHHDDPVDAIDDDPLPRVVTQGPRFGSGRDA